MLTQSDLKKALNYDSTTGIFTRKRKTTTTKVGDIAGCKTVQGYIHIRLNGKKYTGHKLAWLYIYGVFPIKSIQFDHIDHNRSNNAITNLRLVSSSENSKNRSKSNVNTSGVIGVTWHTKGKVWTAQIKVLDKQLSLGSFATFSAAADARKNAEVLYGYHKNHGETPIKDR